MTRGCAVLWCRTVINQDAFNNWSSSDAGPATVDAQSFMAAMEADCQDRADRRRMNEAAAEQLRLDGNAAFNAAEYVKAAELYTKALSHVRYWTTLYTNRAQVYLRLEKFEVTSATPVISLTVRTLYILCQLAEQKFDFKSDVEWNSYRRLESLV